MCSDVQHIICICSIFVVYLTCEMQCPFSSRHLEATGFSQLAKSAYPSCTMTCLWLNNPSRSSLGKTSPVCHPFLSRAQKVLWPPSTYPRHAFRIHPEPKLSSSYTTYIIRIDAPINNLCLNICMILCGHAPHVHAQTFNLISGYNRKIKGRNEIFEPRDTFTCCWVCTQLQELQRRLFLMLTGGRLWRPGEGIMVCCFVRLKKVWSQQKSHLCWVFLIVETLPAIMDSKCQVTSVSFRKR